MTTSYDDIGKSTSDLLNKGYSANGLFKVSAKAVSKSGFSVVVNASRVSKGGKETVSADYEAKNSVVVAGTKIDLTEKYNTDHNLEVTAEVKDVAVEGTKVAVTVSHGSKGFAVKDSIKFSNDSVNLKVGGAYAGSDAPIKFGGNLSVNVDPVVVGVSADYATAVDEKDASVSWGVKASYPSLFNALLFVDGVNNQKQIFVGASASESINDSLTVAATAKVDTQNVAGPQGVLAAQYKFDSETSLKTKLSFQAYPEGDKSSDIRLGLGLSQKMNSNTTANIAADLNARQLAGDNTGGNHTFGVEVKFE